jgi:hypothetical protein
MSGFGEFPAALTPELSKDKAWLSQSRQYQTDAPKYSVSDSNQKSRKGGVKC